MSARLSPWQAALVTAARVGRLATVTPDGAPHLVPVCFAARLAGRELAAVYIALDEKPKRASPRELQRVRNLVAHPSVALLLDRYDDVDWGNLAFARIDGQAALIEPAAPEHAAAVALLRGKYPQYHAMHLEFQPVIAITPTRVSAWRARQGEAAGVPGAPPPRALPFEQLARARRSVRQLSGDPLPPALLRRLVELAAWAPSPHGSQPWRFAVITRAGAKEELAAAMGAAWVRNLAMDGESGDVIAARLAGSTRRLTEAPALIVPCLYTADLDRYPDPARQAAEELMAVQSLGAAVQNLLLAAYDLGLDAGWMCAPLFCPEVVRETLSLPPGVVPHAIVQVGLAAREPRRRPRRPVNELMVRFD